MTEPLAIACTLRASDHSERLAQIRSLGEDSMLSSAVAGREATLRFQAGEPGRERVVAFVAAESECCAFLDFEIADEPGAVVLTIKAPPGGQAILNGLAEAFRSGRVSA